jgi:hypothetical protein
VAVDTALRRVSHGDVDEEILQGNVLSREFDCRRNEVPNPASEGSHYFFPFVSAYGLEVSWVPLATGVNVKEGGPGISPDILPERIRS